MARPDEEGLAPSPDTSSGSGEGADSDKPSAASTPRRETTASTDEAGSGPELGDREDRVGELPRTFADGEAVAERYRIVRFLARGGMGEVYEAEDLTLDERVAIKVLKPGIAGSAGFLGRFKREIQLAHRVTHPNVCRIFDFGQHARTLADGNPDPEGPITFLTMELLEGQTLSERLDRKGRLGTEEALPLLRQMAAALEAAHDAGVIHRDFKSSNVILVPTEGGERAVVTDLGLAREEKPQGDDATTLTAQGVMVGTPAYMAPEQVEGEPVTVRSDLYAFGIVMYETLTGKRPFVGSSPLSTAILRLKEPPTRPRVLVPGLGTGCEWIILKCLQVDPAKRYQSAGELVAALDAIACRGGRLAAGLRAVRWRGVALAALAVVMLAAMVVALVRLGPASFESRAPVDVATRAARRSVAVLGFKNLSARAEAAWLSTALSEMLKTELAAGGALRLLPGEQVARMKIELAVADVDTLARDTLRRVGAYLNADLVVVGSYLALDTASGTQLRLDLRVQETGSGETLSSMAMTGTEEGLFELVAETGERLREALGVGLLSTDEQLGVRTALPSSATAARLYAKGLGRLRVFDAQGARLFLEEAVAADPDYPMAHAALAAAWTALGYDERARLAAETAFELSVALPPEERLMVEGRFREATGQLKAAAEVYRQLWTAHPDDLEHGLRLVDAEIAAGEISAALETVAALRGLGPPARDDPRIDLAEARAARAMSDYRRQLEAASAAVRGGENLGAHLLVARARLLEGSAIEVLEGPHQAQPVYQEAQEIYELAGDRGSMAQAMSHVADVVQRQGDVAGARERYEEALGVFREIGDRAGTARTLSAIGWLLFGQEGDLAGARDRHQEALQIYEEIGNREQTASALRNLGGVQWRQGDSGGARVSFTRALQIFREIDSRRGVARVSRSLGWLLLIGGELPEARSALEEALAVDREISNRRGEGRDLQVLATVLYLQGELPGARERHGKAAAILAEMNDPAGQALALFGLGQVALDEGDVAGARALHEQALALRDEVGETIWISESRLALAEVDIEEGRLDQAEERLRQPVEETELDERADAGAWAHAVHARVLVAQGRLEPAREAIDRAQGFAAVSQRLDIRLRVDLAAARLQVAEGQLASAEQGLRAVLTEAGRTGMARFVLEARLVLGELELLTGRAAAGRQRLEELEREARELGYGLIARHAAEACGEP